MINERGGVEGYKIVPIYADAQSKADVAINEAERLLERGQGRPADGRVLVRPLRADGAEGRRGQEVHVGQRLRRLRRVQGQEPAVRVPRRRCTPTSSARPPAASSPRTPRRKLGKEPKDLKVAIIYEDGPYGVGVATGNEAKCKELGMQIVHKEGYAATSPDLSRAGHQAARARPDVILHTGYNPDITLFLRQSKEQGLKFGGADRPRRRLRPDRQADARPSGKTSTTSTTSIRSRRSCSIPRRWPRAWAT